MKGNKRKKLGNKMKPYLSPALRQRLEEEYRARAIQRKLDAEFRSIVA